MNTKPLMTLNAIILALIGISLIFLPKEILDQILLGVPKTNSKKTDVIVKREKAIERAYKYSKAGDIVLIAGKGHENYQELNGTKIPFDDFKIAKQIFK